MAPYCVVFVPDGLYEIDARELGLVLETDAYSAGQYARSLHPRIMRTLETEAEAQRVCEALCELGLPSFVCTQEEVRRGYPVRRAHRVDVSPEHWVFSFGSDATSAARPEDLLLLIEGRWEIRQTVETTESKGRIRRILGGSRNASERDDSIEHFLHLFFSGEEGAVEVVSDDFDYTGLGETMSYSTLVNFRTLVELVRTSAPDAPLDDRLLRLSPSPVPVERSHQLSAGRHRQLRTETDDNRQAIHQLATLIYLHYARGWQPASEA